MKLEDLTKSELISFILFNFEVKLDDIIECRRCSKLDKKMIDFNFICNKCRGKNDNI